MLQGGVCGVCSAWLLWLCVCAVQWEHALSAVQFQSIQVLDDVLGRLQVCVLAWCVVCVAERERGPLCAPLCPLPRPFPVCWCLLCLVHRALSLTACVCLGVRCVCWQSGGEFKGSLTTVASSAAMTAAAVEAVQVRWCCVCCVSVAAWGGCGADGVLVRRPLSLSLSLCCGCASVVCV